MPSCGIGKKPFGDTKFQDNSASPGVSATEYCKIRAGEVHEIIGIWASMIDRKPLYVLVVGFFCLLVFLDFWGFFLTLKFSQLRAPLNEEFSFLTNFISGNTHLANLNPVSLEHFKSVSEEHCSLTCGYFRSLI